MPRLFALLFLIFGSFGFALPAEASKRVALVIGNGSYEAVPSLSNPRNDAADIGDVGVVLELVEPAK